MDSTKVRLVDYVAIIGFDFEADQRNSKGKILQRFPKEDWPDTSFIEGIEFFCQPLGWQLTLVHKEDSPYRKQEFFQFVLTDIDADRHYCACWTFYEEVKQTNTLTPLRQPENFHQKQLQQQQQQQQQQRYGQLNNTQQQDVIYYYPKCIVLISRLDYPEVFEKCLKSIYASIHDSSLNTLISKLLNIEVPLTGGLIANIQLGTGDTIALQTPPTNSVPATSKNNVYQLIQDLKIYNVVELFYALLTEHKILFYSESYTKLYEACQGLLSLLYPFKYTHTYIPILPATLIEFLSTPTPFVIGVHSSLKEEVRDILDVIVVDLDRCHVKVPDSSRVVHMQEPYHSLLSELLVRITKPEIIHAQDRTPNSSHAQPSPPEIMDKEIRAVFLRITAQILHGYRSCLIVLRIHPRTLISFHKAYFLGQREFVDDDFMTRLLECMFFEKFVEFRGPPYRVCDLFDDLHSTLHEQLREERNDKSAVIKNIKRLAQNLWDHENPSIGLNQSQEKKLVPMGLKAEEVKNEFNANEFVINSARRLEVMRNCVNCIFESKISDARKALPAVLKALKNKDNRLALIDELACYAGSQRAVLEHQQFDLVVRLMNCALQHENEIDVNGVAAKILPLAMEFCRRLCTGVIQFAYTCIQDHRVWSNLQFWESCFQQDVEKNVISLYRNETPRMSSVEKKQSDDPQSNGLGEASSTSTLDKTVVDVTSAGDVSFDSGLEVAAWQSQLMNKLNDDNRRGSPESWGKDEESTVYSQAVHYANRIICMKVPWDISSKASKAVSNLADSHFNPGTNSSQRTPSYTSERNSNSDDESGFQDEIGTVTNSEVASEVIKFASRFVNKVCIDSCVGEELIKALHTMIPQVVAMQIETLESVYRESKRLPPVTKPKITNPDMLDGEELLMVGLRTYLLPDGRDKENIKDESIGAMIGGPVFLPAEGAIFITNYRVIFKGRPCDPFYCEQTIVRSFPTATLTKEKRITVYSMPAVDQYLTEGLQLRSNTFQLIRVAFDEEVTSESIEGFRKHVTRQRYPQNIFNLFAFTSQLVIPNKFEILVQKTKNHKSATLKGLAKRTFMKTAQRAGLKKKDPNKNRYIVDGFANTIAPKDAKTLAVGSGSSASSILSNRHEQPDSFNDSTASSDHSQNHLTALPRSVIGSSTSVAPIVAPHIKSNKCGVNTLAKISQMNYVKDYSRLNLGRIVSSSQSSTNSSNIALSNLFQSSSSKHQRTSSNSNNFIDEFVIASVNLNYSVTRSYPGLVVIPASINDEASITQIARLYKFNRFPAIVWRHARTKALLLRSGGFQGKPAKLEVFGKPGQTLHIMTEKALIKNIKPETHRSCEFISLDLHEVKQVKSNFVKFLRVCVPSAPLPPNESESSFAKTIESSEWFIQLKSILDSANSIVDLLDSEGKSVLLAIEDGRDLTPQITSIAQLCLDPYYRTFEGFRVLIEKEWLAFGHRFSHRLAHAEAKPVSGLAPLFLQFLDLVHQIHNQFPLSFEFNQYYLKFLAYHHVSCRFRTFLTDCEAERSECGWLNQELISPAHSLSSFSHKSNHGSSGCVSGGSNNSASNINLNAIGRGHSRQGSELSDISLSNNNLVVNQDSISPNKVPLSNIRASSNASMTMMPVNTVGTSFWDYADKLWNQSPIFFNYYYTPVNFLDPAKNVVLKPSSNMAIFKLWSYYTSEELVHGPSYDIEIFNMTRQHQEELQASLDQTKISKRRLVVTNHDCIHLTQPDGLTQSMGDLRNMEQEYNLNPSQWSNLWSKIETSLPVS